jgi:hypothetical protein
VGKPTASRPYLNPDGSILTSRPEFHAHKDPRYLEAVARRDDLARKRGAIDEAIRAEHEELTSRGVSKTERAHAEALAAGVARPAAERRLDVDGLAKERRILQAALEMAERNMFEIERQVSVEICKKVRSAYVEINRELFPILRRLEDFMNLEWGFLRGLEDGGTRLYLLPRLGCMGIVPEAAIASIIDQAKTHYGVDLAEDPSESSAV